MVIEKQLCILSLSNIVLKIFYFELTMTLNYYPVIYNSLKIVEHVNMWSLKADDWIKNNKARASKQKLSVQ